MTQAKQGMDAATLHVGQRVCRKATDEFGTVTESNGKVGVKWDNGRTSYFRRDKAANVRLMAPKQ